MGDVEIVVRDNGTILLPKRLKLDIFDEVSWYLGGNCQTFNHDLEETIKNVAKNNRTPEQIREDCSVGLAVEWATFNWMYSIGVKADLPPKGRYHIDLVLRNIWVDDVFYQTANVDVKTIVRRKTFEQTPWEAKNVGVDKETGDTVLYFCVARVTGTNDYVFSGVSWDKDLNPGSYGRPFVTKFSEIILSLG